MIKSTSLYMVKIVTLKKGVRAVIMVKNTKVTVEIVDQDKLTSNHSLSFLSEIGKVLQDILEDLEFEDLIVRLRSPAEYKRSIWAKLYFWLLFKSKIISVIPNNP